MHHRRWLGLTGAVGVSALALVLALALAAPARADTAERPSPWEATAPRAEEMVDLARSSAELRLGPDGTSAGCLLGTAAPDPLARFLTYSPVVFGLVCDVEPAPAGDVGCVGEAGASRLPCPTQVEAPIARVGRSDAGASPGFEPPGMNGGPALGGAMPTAAPAVPLVSGDASTGPAPPAGQTGEFAVSGLDDGILASALASVFLLAALAGLHSSRREPAMD